MIIRYFSAGILAAICLFSTGLVWGEEEAEGGREITVVFSPRHKAMLSSEVSARIVELNREFGQTFKKGEVLIRLDATHSERSLSKMESLLWVAEANLKATKRIQKSQSTIKRSEANLKLAVANLTVLEKIAAEKIHFKKASAEVEVARKNLTATEKLYKDNIASNLDYENAKKDFIISEANLQLSDAAQKTELENARKSVTVAKADLEVTMSSMAPELENARKDLAIARNNVKLAQKELETCTVLAPFDGRVRKVLVNRHELVQGSQNLLEVVSDQILLGQFLIPSDAFRQITLGQKIDIAVVETGSTVTAAVSHISATIDPASESFMVYAEIDNSSLNLRSGMRGHFSLPRPDRK